MLPHLNTGHTGAWYLPHSLAPAVQAMPKPSSHGLCICRTVAFDGRACVRRGRLPRMPGVAQRRLQCKHFLLRDIQCLSNPPAPHPSHSYLIHQHQGTFRVGAASRRGEQTVGLSGGHRRNPLHDDCLQVCAVYVGEERNSPPLNCLWRSRVTLFL